MQLRIEAVVDVDIHRNHMIQILERPFISRPKREDPLRLPKFSGHLLKRVLKTYITGILLTEQEQKPQIEQRRRQLWTSFTIAVQVTSTRCFVGTARKDDGTLADLADHGTNLQ